MTNITREDWALAQAQIEFLKDALRLAHANEAKSEEKLNRLWHVELLLAEAGIKVFEYGGRLYFELPAK